MLQLDLNHPLFYFSGVLEKIGIQPEIQRIGRYKSAGDQLSRKSMSKEVCEMLTTLLDNIYENWLETISSSLGVASVELNLIISNSTSLLLQS